MKKILFYGDSNTWGWDPRGYLQRYDHTWVDYIQSLLSGYMVFSDGMPGRMVRDCEYDTSLDGYDAIGVMLGINDLIHYYSVDMIVKQMKIFLDSLEHPFLILMSVPIMKDACKELNDAYKKMGYPYIELDALDFSFDGIHLSEKGHKQLADMVVSQIGGLTL